MPAEYSRDHQTQAKAHVTVLLQAAASGDMQASNELLPLIYAELRKLASSNMQHEMDAGAGHTLQPTALVHEAYMRLVGDGERLARRARDRGIRD